VPSKSQRNSATNAEKTPEGTNGGANDGTTTGDSGTTVAGGTTTEARSTTTTGPAPSAKTRISLSETSATGAKHRVPVAAGTEGNTTTAADGTTTEASETTVADGTTTEASETTVADGTTTGASETTVADGTTKVAVVNNAGPSTTTTGRAPSATTPIFHSETSATVAKSPVREAVVAEATAGSHPVATRRGITNGEATKEVNSVEGPNKAGVVLDHSSGEPQMFNLEERGENGRDMRTINHHEISGLQGSLSEGTTERAWKHGC